VDDCGGGNATNYRIKITDLSTGVYDYSDYFEIIIRTQTAFLRIYNFRQLTNDEIVASLETNTGWSGLTIVEYDKGDMNGASDQGGGCNDCLQLWQDQLGLHHNWIFVDHPSEDGLPVDNDCSNVRIDFKGRLESTPSSSNGFFLGTDRNMPSSPPGSPWQWCETIKTTCAWEVENISDSYLYLENVGTRIYLWFIEPGSYKDGWACDLKFTFEGWEVPAGSPPSVETIRVISAKDNPQYLPANQTQKSDVD